jgi:S-formylglutathione hydrolase FrmB
LLVLLVPPAAQANVLPRPLKLERINRKLHGRLIDHTANHGVDRRIWSPALGQKRDLYVYLPPGYDPAKQYPLILYLHGFAQDEVTFIERVAPRLDRAIVAGEFPPVIVAAPDGSLSGLDCLFSAGSFFINSKAGAFETYLMEDVWNFVHAHYSVRPEREAHAVVGVSMGGGAAFNKAIKYRERFAVVAGVFPPLNLRWLSCRGRYRDKFDPCCWEWRTDFSRSHEVVARFAGGLVPIRLKRLVQPLYGRNNPDTAAEVSRENPIEMLEPSNVRPGDLHMYIAYGGHDEFNVDTQVESFLYVARRRGLEITVHFDPEGHHNKRTALKMMPGVLDWLGPLLAPYSPH